MINHKYYTQNPVTYMSPSDQCTPIVFVKCLNSHKCIDLLMNISLRWCSKLNITLFLMMLYCHLDVTHAIYDHDVSVHWGNRATCIDTLSACHPLTNDSLLLLWLGTKTHVSYSYPITTLIGHLYVMLQPIYSHCVCEVS